MKKNSILPMNVSPGYVPKVFVECLSMSHKALSNLLPIQMGTSALPNRARTENGHAFLASEAEWALLIDSDMTWLPDAIIRLMKTAKETGAKAISGLTFMQQHGRIVPHAYQYLPQESHPNGKVLAPYAVLPTMTEPFKVQAVGGACFLVHRDVYEGVAKMQLLKGETAYLWQEERYLRHEKAMRGEDLVFCERINEAGYDILYEPRAPFLHTHKPDVIKWAEYVAFLDAQGIPHPFQALT